MRSCMTEIGFIQALPMGALGDNRTSMEQTMSAADSKIYTEAERLRLVAVSGLDQQESIIAEGIRSFVVVGRALMEIRDGQLYKERGFPTFESYCRQRWEMNRGHANRLIGASCLVESLDPIGSKPSNEAQV